MARDTHYMNTFIDTYHPKESDEVLKIPGNISPVHLNLNLESFHLILSFQKQRKNCKWWSDSVHKKIWLVFIL
jgi:hypothetical protein